MIPVLEKKRDSVIIKTASPWSAKVRGQTPVQVFLALNGRRFRLLQQPKFDDCILVDID